MLYEMWTLGSRPYGKWNTQKILLELDRGYRLPLPSACSTTAYSMMVSFSIFFKRLSTQNEMKRCLVCNPWNFGLVQDVWVSLPGLPLFACFPISTTKMHSFSPHILLCPKHVSSSTAGTQTHRSDPAWCLCMPCCWTLGVIIRAAH